MITIYILTAIFAIALLISIENLFNLEEKKRNQFLDVEEKFNDILEKRKGSFKEKTTIAYVIMSMLIPLAFAIVTIILLLVLLLAPISALTAYQLYLFVLITSYVYYMIVSGPFRMSTVLGNAAMLGSFTEAASERYLSSAYTKELVFNFVFKAVVFISLLLAF